MKKQISSIKLIMLLLITLFTNCNSDNCDDSDLATTFPAKFRIVSNNGMNQLSNPNFDESLLKIFNPEFTDDFGFDFSIQELNGELIIESQIINANNIAFEYDGTNRFEVIISDKQIETIDCTVETLSFIANANDGTLLCNCSINDFVTIEFDI
jgi:hypothetical protein